MNLFIRNFIAVLLMAFVASPAWALTAFQAKAIAEKQLSPEAKGKLIRIQGDRDPKALTPNTWSFVFFDPRAEQNGRFVKIQDSSVVEIRDGYFDLGSFRLAAYKPAEVIDPATLKLDSSQALEKVNQSAELKKVKLSTVTFALQREEVKQPPIWKLNFFADKEGKEVEIGYALVSAETGTVLEMRLELKKLK